MRLPQGADEVADPPIDGAEGGETAAIVARDRLPSVAVEPRQARDEGRLVGDVALVERRRPRQGRVAKQPPVSGGRHRRAAVAAAWMHPAVRVVRSSLVELEVEGPPAGRVAANEGEGALGEHI